MADSVVLRECWDDRILETYLAQIALDESGEEVWSHEMGSVDDCGGPFRRALRELSIPAIDDVDEELRGALDEVARDGAPARERDR